MKTTSVNHFQKAMYRTIYKRMRQLYRICSTGETSLLEPTKQEVIDELSLYLEYFPDVFTPALTTFQWHIQPKSILPNSLEVLDNKQCIATFTYHAITFIHHLYTVYKEQYQDDIQFLRYILLVLYTNNKPAVLAGIRQYRQYNKDDISIEYKELMQKQTAVYLSKSYSAN